MASEAMTAEALALEEALQKAAILNFGATWHGIAKRQMMAHGIARTITEFANVNKMNESTLVSILLELAGEAPSDD